MWFINMRNKDQKRIFQYLKKLLKQKKISYKSLGKSLEQAESTIKRLFQLEECSLGKLTQICEVIGISVFDLIEGAKKDEISLTFLSDRAQRFFVNNYSYFIFFMQILRPESVSTKLKLNRTQTLEYYRKLEELGLIELHPGDKVKVKLTTDYLGIKRKSELEKKIYQDIGPSWFSNLIENMQDERFHLELNNIHLTQKSWDELNKELTSVFEKYYKTSSLERKLEPDETVFKGYVFGFGSPVKL